ncbi:PREDICTED: uncharacterized protein LOC106751218 [Dinoponera quadriceps]|uniref:Uncharacterized protein LOC106751218 n=1 Tax=Dinoponera quadriceps TaxID=609295 RepID=A0A6P3YC55_DINQU|nr:PREDICTED: uncharacterized protein LOC106751218 [Dinoponera quadriceps]
MKTIVILIVLIATGVAYADNEYARRWRQDYKECAEMFGVHIDVRIDLILCAAIKDGEFLYTDGSYNAELGLRNLQMLIPDPVRFQHASLIYHKCDIEDLNV